MSVSKVVSSWESPRVVQTVMQYVTEEPCQLIEQVVADLFNGPVRAFLKEYIQECSEPYFKPDRIDEPEAVSSWERSRVVQTVMQYVAEEPRHPIEQIVTDIFKGQTRAFLKEYIQEYYEVFFKSDKIDAPEEADHFWLAEIHENPFIVKINGIFVNIFGGIALGEGIDSLRGMDVRVAARWYGKPESPTKYYQNDHLLVGWDVSLWVEKEIQDRIFSDKTRWANFEQMREKWHAREEVPDEFYAELCESVRLRNEVSATKFPLRTAAMVLTIQYLAKARCVGVAGLQHLVQEIQDSRYCLDLFYDALRQLKATVLIPKILKHLRQPRI